MGIWGKKEKNKLISAMISCVCQQQSKSDLLAKEGKDLQTLSICLLYMFARKDEVKKEQEKFEDL